MLDWPDDWDEQGSPGYSESTWARGVDFIWSNVRGVWKDRGVSIDAPRILPGPDGSIDIHWKTDAYELLVNMPAVASQPATYYGDRRGQNMIKGTIDTSQQQIWLLVWMAG
jgi:hypothetical protein